MPNENLKNALLAAGMTPEEFADTVQVDPRTVERWVAGRTPRRRHRATISRALDIPIGQLWPDTITPTPSTPTPGTRAPEQPGAADTNQTPDPEPEPAPQPEPEPGECEVVATWGYSNAPGTPNAARFLQSATDRVDLLDAASGLLNNPGILDVLARCATTGAHVRVLANAPTPELARLAAHPRVEVRHRDATLAHAVLRADDTMLLALKLGDGGMPPLLKLTRHADHGLFDRLCAHFDAGWDGAHPIPADPTETTQPDPAAQSSEAEPRTPAPDGPRRRWPGRPD